MADEFKVENPWPTIQFRGAISGTALQGPCIHLPTSTATPTPIADESMADEFKVENPWPTIQFRSAWHSAYARIHVHITYTYVYIIHKLPNIEIPEKKKRV